MKRILPIILLTLSFAESGFSSSADSTHYRSLNLMYNLTQVCHDAQKGMKTKYMSPAQFNEVKSSYDRQILRFNLTKSEKSKINKAVKNSDELTMMSAIIRSGNFSQIVKSCSNYRTAIILSEYGF